MGGRRAGLQLQQLHIIAATEINTLLTLVSFITRLELPPVQTSEGKLSTDTIFIVPPNYQLLCATLKSPLDSGDRFAPTAPSAGPCLRISALKPNVRSSQYLDIEKKTT